MQYLAWVIWVKYKLQQYLLVLQASFHTDVKCQIKCCLLRFTLIAASKKHFFNERQSAFNAFAASTTFPFILFINVKSNYLSPSEDLSKLSAPNIGHFAPKFYAVSKSQFKLGLTYRQLWPCPRPWHLNPTKLRTQQNHILFRHLSPSSQRARLQRPNIQNYAPLREEWPAPEVQIKMWFFSSFHLPPPLFFGTSLPVSLLTFSTFCLPPAFSIGTMLPVSVPTISSSHLHPPLCIFLRSFLVY